MNQSVNRIAFVCTANICRSPFAEWFFKMHKPVKLTVDAFSFGIQPMRGEKPPKPLLEIAHEFDVDMSDHTSRGDQDFDLDSFSLILVMESFHKQELELKYKEIGHKTHLLRNFAQQGAKTRDIKDPYGMTDDFVRACYDDIAEAVDGLFKHLS